MKKQYQYQVRQMTDNKVVRSFNTSEEAEQWLKNTFSGVSQIIGYYVSMAVPSSTYEEELNEFFELSDETTDEQEDEYKQPIDILKENFDEDAKEYLTLLAIQYKGNWDSISAAINNREKIIINKDFELMKLYYSDFRVVTIFEEEYPSILKQSYKAPFVLFYSGDLRLVDYAPRSIGVLGDDLEDAVVDSLVNTGNFVTMVGKELIEITDGVANVFVSTTFGDEMSLLDKARMFSSLSKEVWLDGKEETALNLMVMLYAVKFDMRAVATNSSFIEDTAGDNVVVVDSFSDMLNI
jgi:hypothetical protein